MTKQESPGFSRGNATTIAFTGSRRLSEMGQRIVGKRLERILESISGKPECKDYRFVTGACIGVDDFVAGWLLTCFELAPEQQVIVVPADRSRVTANLDHYDKVGCRIEYMPAGTSYEDRNYVMVGLAKRDQGWVEAFPAHSEADSRSVRSGTWLTVHLARQAGLGANEFVLDVLGEHLASLDKAEGRVKERKGPKTTVVNLHKDPYDVYIGRAGNGKDGYFGNPFPVEIEGREAALDKYRTYFDQRVATDAEFRLRLATLRGKRLGCFCKPQACHGDAIVEWLER